MPERALLAALDTSLTTPTSAESAKLLFDALQALPTRPFSDGVVQKLLALAALRATFHRDFLHHLTGALAERSEPEAIAFMLDLLADDGIASSGVDALDKLDPRIVAEPLRAWLAVRAEDVKQPLMVRGLSAKTDLAAPRADGQATPVTSELLEYWLQREDFPTLRAALGAGADVNASIDYGESMLHYAMNAWRSAAETGSSMGAPPEEWETFIRDLFAAGADADRKLASKFTDSGDELSWAKGSTPRKMLKGIRDRGVDEELVARVEALFPAPPAKGKAKAPKS